MPDYVRVKTMSDSDEREQTLGIEEQADPPPSTDNSCSLPADTTCESSESSDDAKSSSHQRKPRKSILILPENPESHNPSVVLELDLEIEGAARNSTIGTLSENAGTSHNATPTSEELSYVEDFKENLVLRKSSGGTAKERRSRTNNAADLLFLGAGKRPAISKPSSSKPALGSLGTSALGRTVSSRPGMAGLTKPVSAAVAGWPNIYEMDLVLVSSWNLGDRELEDDRNNFHEQLKYWGCDSEEVNRKLAAGEEVEPTIKLKHFKSG